jgi:hypothetical protein
MNTNLWTALPKIGERNEWGRSFLPLVINLLRELFESIIRMLDFHAKEMQLFNQGIYRPVVGRIQELKSPTE